jgi:hypothetical protein
VLVGKNEAGKSAVIRGLSRINRSDGAKCDGLHEFPRRRFSDEYDKSVPAGSARFALDDDEREAAGPPPRSSTSSSRRGVGVTSNP